MSASKTDNDETTEVKRTSRCPGCGAPPSKHGWGIPNRFCEGKEKSSPHRQRETIPKVQDVDTTICELEEELASLDIQEEQLAKARRVTDLQRRVALAMACMKSWTLVLKDLVSLLIPAAVSQACRGIWDEL